MSEEYDSFLKRWSSKKQAQREAGVDADTAPLIESETANQSEPSLDTENQLTDADMPPLESLGEESDYSGFLSPEVSEALRKKALRKMFHLAAYIT